MGKTPHSAYPDSIRIFFQIECFQFDQQQLPQTATTLFGADKWDNGERVFILYSMDTYFFPRWYG